MKKIVIYFLLFLSSVIFAQKTHTKELGIKSDNDLYASIRRDRYYTNGVFFSYRYLSSKNREKAIKRIYELQIGQELYSAQRANVIFMFEHDRPFAGYLFGSFGFSNFYKNNSILNIKSQIGFIGSNSFGEETMSFVHRVYGFNQPVGWKYQIADAFTLNFQANYTKNISKLSSTYFATDWVNKVNTGLIFNNYATALNFRIGLLPLKSITNSMAYQANLNSNQTTKKEFFLNIKPILNFNFYDATIQGSILNETSPITYGIKPVVFSSELGIYYAINNINIGYRLLFHSRKVENPEVASINKYGSIHINYLF